MGVTVATDLADPVSQYSDVIGEPLDAAMLGELSSSLARNHSVDVLLARRVRSDSGLHGALAASDAAIVSTTEAPFVCFTRYPDFPAYTASFSKSTLRRTRQHSAKLEAEHGALSFEVLPGTNARQAILTAASWKKNWLNSQYLLSRVFDDGPNEAALIESCASPDCHVSILSAGGRAIAFEIGFSGGPHYASYLGAYDPDFADYGVGKLQALRTIEWCFSMRFARYDLLPPDGEYKQHWARHQAGEPVRDYGVALTRPGQMYLFVRRHARAGVQRTVESIPPSMRGAAKRYAPAALSAGAAAAAIAMMND
jgi:CelD/BcsL family acetyltransferase involved in cellulose biosynthesis